MVSLKKGVAENLPVFQNIKSSWRGNKLHFSQLVMPFHKCPLIIFKWMIFKPSEAQCIIDFLTLWLKCLSCDFEIRRAVSCGISSQILAFPHQVPHPGAVCWEVSDIKSLIWFGCHWWQIFYFIVGIRKVKDCGSEGVFPRQHISPKAGIQSIRNSMCIPWPLISLPDHWSCEWI